ncbi:hypothetical protein IWQ60_010254 [Tieghemiomyces parasiticus]|uniref:Uncharacterized protein n=1 Tax=Tieghemiomyces parasiticus TaxID=78921 RepID=A0A9W8DIP0_9FUNG|nr:hypothetical protein IWQ60_010254 [Tieghemiomyces parasiticus]
MEALESHGLFQFGGSDSEDDGLDLFGSSQAKPDRLAYDLVPHKASYAASQETPGHFLRPLARQDFGAWFAEKHGPTDIRQAIDFLYYRRRFVEALHLCTRFLEEAEVARTRKPPVLIHITEQVLTAAQCTLRLGDLDAARNWAQMSRRRPSTFMILSVRNQTPRRRPTRFLYHLPAKMAKKLFWPPKAQLNICVGWRNLVACPPHRFSKNSSALLTSHRQ